MDSDNQSHLMNEVVSRLRMSNCDVLSPHWRAQHLNTHIRKILRKSLYRPIHCNNTHPITICAVQSSSRSESRIAYLHLYWRNLQRTSVQYADTYNALHMPRFEWCYFLGYITKTTAICFTIPHWERCCTQNESQFLSLLASCARLPESLYSYISYALDQFS